MSTAAEAPSIEDDAPSSSAAPDYSNSSSSASSPAWDDPPLSSSDDVLDLTTSPLLRRYPSFVPLRRRATSIAEVAFLVPSASSHLRQASAAAATFNMTATIIGGGVLSIPLSCARAGIVPFTVLMSISAIATDFSLYLLVSCARRCGSTNYGSVCRAAYGPALETFATAVILCSVGCAVAGLMILNRGIWSPIVIAGIHWMQGRGGDGGTVTTWGEDATVLLVLMIGMMPFLLKKDLTSLRHICYVGFFSIALLCVAMAYRAYERNVSQSGLFSDNIKWVASSRLDILASMPIILQAFLCSFNMVQVSCALANPTRDRVRKVVREAVGLSFLVMYAFGIAGYLCAYDGTRGNVLLNFDPEDPVILLGRVGCGITTLFALPMNVLPTREAILSLASQASEAWARRGAVGAEERRYLVEARRSAEDGGDGDSRKPRAGSVSEPPKGGVDEENCLNRATMPGYGAAGNKSNAKVYVKSGAAAGRQSIPKKSEDVIHWVTTFAIVVVCYVVAVLAPGVAIVWDITGSSMAFLIQFIMPALSYIRLKLRHRGRRAWSRNLVLAWILLVFATIMSVVCTVQVALKLSGRL